MVLALLSRGRGGEIVATDENFCTSLVEEAVHSRSTHSALAQTPPPVRLVAMLENDGDKSWVTRWQGADGKIPGMYAIKVYGKAPFPRAL